MATKDAPQRTDPDTSRATRFFDALAREYERQWHNIGAEDRRARGAYEARFVGARVLAALDACGLRLSDKPKPRSSRKANRKGREAAP